MLFRSDNLEDNFKQVCHLLEVCSKAGLIFNSDKYKIMSFNGWTNIKRLIRKLPFGKLTVSSYLAALWLVKENTDMSDEEIGSVLREATGIDPNTIELAENNLFINNDGYLQEGTYILNKELLLPFTGENLIQKGSSIVVNENTQQCGSIFNVPEFKVWHENTYHMGKHQKWLFFSI